MDATVMTMLRGSQCESVPFEHDAPSFMTSRSLVEICTRFLACMVDTQDYVCQLKSTYLKELWPKVCEEMMEVKAKGLECEKDLLICRKEKEDQKISYLQQIERMRMSMEEERSRMLDGAELVQEFTGKVGDPNDDVGLDFKRGTESRMLKDVENFKKLCDDLREQNKVLQQTTDQCDMINQELVASNQKLREDLQRIHHCDRLNQELSVSNQKLRQELQVQAAELDKLKQDVAIQRLKEDVVAQYKSCLQDSEERYTQARRLSLKQKRLSDSKYDRLWREHNSENVAFRLDGQKASQAGTSFEARAQNLGTYNELRANAKHRTPTEGQVDIGADSSYFEGKFSKLSTRDQQRKSSVDETASKGDRTPHASSLASQPGVHSENRHVPSNLVHSLKRPQEGNGPEEPRKLDSPPPEFEKVGSDEALASVHFVSENAGKLTELCGVDLKESDGIGIDSPGAKAEISTHSPKDARLKPLSLASGIKGSSTSKFSSYVHFDAAKGRANGRKSKERKWRNTRSRNPGEDTKDHHDSFLNTPMELIKANLRVPEDGQASQSHLTPLTRQSSDAGIASKGLSNNPSRLVKGKEANLAFEWTDDAQHEVLSPGNKTVSGNSARSASSSECTGKVTKAPTAPTSDEKRHLPSSKAPRYKFNEPVRRKRDREQLEATDCLQCRKFYDAVLAEDADGVVMDRCEHHNAVSRHRYNYLPPGTPVGFWNIGFEPSL